MRSLKKTLDLLCVLIIFFTAIRAGAQDGRIFYAVEIDGVLCGYATTDVSDITCQGSPAIETRDTVHLMLKALGQDMNMKIISKHVFRPESYKMILNRSKFDYDAGNVVETINEVFDGYVLRTELPRELPDTIPTGDDVIFDNPLSAPFLIKDFVQEGEKEKTYRVFDYMRGRIVDQRYTLLDEETISLAGKDHDVMVFNVFNATDGLNSKFWVRKTDGMTLRLEVMNRNIYLADEAVAKQISTVDLDNSIFAKVGKNIPAFMDMSYLRVKADLKSAGEGLSVESLNFPGQKFEGTVEDNHVKGIFEIEPRWYDGQGAPPFPPDHKGNKELKKYLEPELFIESDHPEIIAKAKEVTAGAADSWDAVVRLSKWVGHEIRGAVPGGTSAINTLRTMEGECGSHSRLLAALCRASGIPARLSVGCMYSPWYGGSFGQHAWNEVYMGEDIGWVAIDATILEFDYVDAGHVKLGEMTSFQPVSMEILDYKIAGDTGQMAGAEVPPEFASLIGPYTNMKDRNVLEVQYSGGGIAVDIMGRMLLALHPPDGQGRRYAKLSDAVYFSFPENENGEVDRMLITEKVYAMKKLDEEVSIAEEVPSELAGYIGNYVIFQLQAGFSVSYEDGSLAMKLPDVEGTRALEKTSEEDRWKDPVDGKEYAFKKNSEGKVEGMNIYVTNILHKGATAAWIVEKAIEKDGLEVAAASFRELWNNRALDPENTEKDMNDLGYKYLNDSKTEEALMVFGLNVETFPQSWNVYDSYGEALMKKGDTVKAVKNYERSLELNPGNENGKKMLEKLRSQE
jgi:hypothetical protein